MSEGLARVHSLPTLSGQLRKTANAAGLHASSAQTGPQSPCTCKQFLLSYLQHARFTAEKKVLKGRWSWLGSPGLGGGGAGLALALHPAGPPVYSRLVLHNLLKGTISFDALRGRKNRTGWGCEKWKGAMVHHRAPWGIRQQREEARATQVRQLSANHRTVRNTTPLHTWHRSPPLGTGTPGAPTAAHTRMHTHTHTHTRSSKTPEVRRLWT